MFVSISFLLKIFCIFLLFGVVVGGSISFTRLMNNMILEDSEKLHNLDIRRKSNVELKPFRCQWEWKEHFTQKQN